MAADGGGDGVTQVVPARQRRQFRQSTIDTLPRLGCFSGLLARLPLLFWHSGGPSSRTPLANVPTLACPVSPQVPESEF